MSVVLEALGILMSSMSWVHECLNQILRNSTEQFYSHRDFILSSNARKHFTRELNLVIWCTKKKLP